MFVIVRHGDTFVAGEPPRRIGARTDLPLTARGEQQARALGAHFTANRWRFARVLASPLDRTLATARLILEHQDDAPGVEICDFLREIDHGPDEDRTEEAVLARIGSAALAAWERRAEPPPGWIVDAEIRRGAWRDLFAASGPNGARVPGPTLLVTSNGAARFALLSDPALAEAMSGLPNLKLPTGGYGVIRPGADGAFEVPVWGRRP